MDGMSCSRYIPRGRVILAFTGAPNRTLFLLSQDKRAQSVSKYELISENIFTVAAVK